MFDRDIAKPLLDSWRGLKRSADTEPGAPPTERDPDTALAIVAYARHLAPGLAVPALLDLLDHEAPTVGSAALAELLRRYTPAEGDLGYSAAQGSAARRHAIDRWRAAWRDHPDAFR
jgi:hypothetical protein